jgi:hypothetical protein
MSRLEWLGCLIAGLLVSILPGCSEQEARSALPVLPCEGASLGSYLFRFGGPDEAPLSVERFACQPAAGAGPAQMSQALVSVLADVQLYGPGSWNPATQRLSATVRITNLGSLDLDEPRMQVRWVTPSDAGIVFEQVHWGSGGVGSAYAYADIQAPPGANNASARQNMVIYDPQAVPFSFAVDILAETGSLPGAIFPDRDDDRFNIEPAEPAGDDCDDEDPSRYPGHLCACDTGCDPCTAGGCCEEFCSGNCDPVCSAAGCTCYFYADPNKSMDAICEPGSSCHLNCIQAKDCSVADCEQAGTCEIACVDAHDCEIEACDAGATCQVSCDLSHDCELKTCEDHSSCQLSCVDTHDCDIKACDGGAICSLDCQDSHNCEIKSCENSADCDLVCNGDHDCAIKACEDANCSVTCTDTDKCQLKGCRADATCILTCGLGVDKCELECKDGQTEVDCGNGVLVCSNTACP